MIDAAYIESRIDRLPQIEAELSDPKTAADQKRFRQLVQEHASIRRLQEKAEAYFHIQNSIREHKELLAEDGADPELAELAREEVADMEQQLPGVEQALLLGLLPPDPDDARNAIVEIRAGTGGAEAALFAGDLLRMYSRYAEETGWKTNIIDASTSDLGGYKDAVFSVTGAGAYGALKYESGGHRVQRIPVTEAAGRIHTSAATVAVFPEAEPEDDIEIDPNDLRVDIFCASGPGGQGVNTTYSAIRITHLPTGLVAQSQDERSQHRNKEKALGVLKSRILDHNRRQEEERMGVTRRSMIGSGDRSERVRTYNFPQNRLTDHRINLTLYSLDRIIEGEIGPILSALGAHDVQLRLKAKNAAV